MSHKVTIELVFKSSNGDSDEEMTVLDVDVYDHLEDLIACEALDYTVTPESGETYGVIRYSDNWKSYGETVGEIYESGL